MDKVNLNELEFSYDDADPDGYRAGSARLGPAIGATLLGATVYELAEGQSICPYHYEFGCEEWAIVLAGRPLLRHQEGEQGLEPGDTVCFPEGPSGGHKLTNVSGETVRVMLLSNKAQPVVVVYPDSDKIGVWGVDDNSIMVRRESGVDYYDREV